MQIHRGLFAGHVKLCDCRWWHLRLEDLVYPVVVDAAAGAIRYDNFEGRWGDPQQLSRFLQAYAAEKAKIEARRHGHTVTEQALTDGSIKLTIQVGGGA